MTIIEILNNNLIITKKVNASEFSSACPGCGGEEPTSDRFRIWPDKGPSGRAWCRSCNWKGDGIQLLRDFYNHKYIDASRTFNIEPKAQEKTYKPKRARPLNVPKEEKEVLTFRDTQDPPSRWLAKASALALWALRHLLSNKEKMAYLNKRGIDKETVRKLCLGYNPATLYRKRIDWGLEVNDGDNDLYFPKGIVIPAFNSKREARQANRLRFRKDELRDADDARYIILAGSSMTPFILHCTNPTRPSAVVVVESELCAALIWQEAGDFVTVAAMGSCAVHPDKATADLFTDAPLILNALDYGDKSQAGAKASVWWEKNFIKHKRWPVPYEGDPSEYHEAGGSIKTWLSAGLPPGLQPYEKEVTINKGYNCGPTEPLSPEREIPEGVDPVMLNEVFGEDGKPMSAIIKTTCSRSGCNNPAFIGTFNKSMPAGECIEHSEGKAPREVV